MTASALENHLNVLESKVDELLAVFQTHDMSQHDESTKNQDTGTSQDELKSDDRGH